jgi:hypothetical protein
MWHGSNCTDLDSMSKQNIFEAFSSFKESLALESFRPRVVVSLKKMNYIRGLMSREKSPGPAGRDKSPGPAGRDKSPGPAMAKIITGNAAVEAAAPVQLVFCRLKQDSFC